jgi:luciferase family oxidoreductase group 1
MDSIPLSVLDLCPVVEGQPVAQAFAQTLDLAKFVEGLGYQRYWVAEHHSMAGIASASPEIIIGHIAQCTSRLRVGSGGIMLPNHAPLRIAEAFRTLEAFHPGRIDLGVGRAPGTNPATTVALRRSREQLHADNFPQELEQLKAYLESQFIPDSPYQEVVAMPTVSTVPELWMLGSSDFGAQLAAHLGMPFAFAQHFSPLSAAQVLSLYRQSFQPSAMLAKPHALVAVHVICGETDKEAAALAMPSDIAFYRYRTTGRSRPLPTLAEAQASPLNPTERLHLETLSFPKFVGSLETVRKKLEDFCENTHPDELMVLSMIPDHEARKKSYERLSRFQ